MLQLTQLLAPNGEAFAVAQDYCLSAVIRCKLVVHSRRKTTLRGTVLMGATVEREIKSLELARADPVDFA